MFYNPSVWMAGIQGRLLVGSFVFDIKVSLGFGCGIVQFTPLTACFVHY